MTTQNTSPSHSGAPNQTVTTATPSPPSSTTTQPVSLVAPSIAFAIGAIVATIGNYIAGRKNVEAAKAQADRTLDVAREQIRADKARSTSEQMRAREEEWRLRKLDAHLNLLTFHERIRDELERGRLDEKSSYDTDSLDVEQYAKDKLPILRDLMSAVSFFGDPLSISRSQECVKRLQELLRCTLDGRCRDAYSGAYKTSITSYRDAARMDTGVSLPSKEST